jgi:MYXO-CTERM domain-containing protein
MELAMRIAAFLACTLTAASASAQTLDRNFDADRNGPWTVAPLVVGGDACDPRGVVVHEGAPHVACKVPLEGPPRGGALLRVDGAAATPVATLDDDPSLIAEIDGALLIGTKGTVTNADPQVLALEGGGWRTLHDVAFGAEIRALAQHRGELHVATKSDGVFVIRDRGLVRVGARATTVPEGYQWSPVGDWTVDVHDAALGGDQLVAVGKDLRVRRWDGAAWADLGNVAEATYGDGGVPVTFLREPKAVAVGADGTIYAGTKGMAGSAEGKDVGAVWRWDGTGWLRLGTAAMKKEVKRLVVAGGALWAGTNESGVWRWDGAAWIDTSAGLPAETDGKVKGERLSLGADGALYVAIKNSVLRRALTGETWTEVGFFPNGEEATSTLIDQAGALWVGAKVGASGGAVYRRDGATWTQLGTDLAREVKQLVQTASGDLYAVLGGGAGAARWTGTAWVSVLGNLSGDASDFKGMLLVSDVDLVAVTKVGLQRGAFQREPLEIIESALRNLDLGGLVALGDQLFAITKQDGVLRVAADASGDDGQWWVAGANGVPGVELTTAAVVDRRVFVIAKRLLYAASLGADGRLQATAFGANPGKATLDGNGDLVFTGETEFTAVAAHGDRVFAGTKDGLFVSDDGGLRWELFNGPAEIKALTIADGVLRALIVATTVPDPVGAPTVSVKTAAVWSRDLMVVDEPTPPDDDGGGCSTSSAPGAGLIALVGLAFFPVLLRRRERAAGKPKSWLHWSRTVHTWAGVVLALFVFVEGCTGLFLLHKDDLPGLADTPLPFGGEGGREARLEQATLDPADPTHLIAATRDRVVHSRDGGGTWAPVSPHSGFDKIEALAVAAGAIWVGHGDGLARCSIDGATCAAVDLQVADRPEVRAIVATGDRLIVALHRHGVRISDDGGARWRDATATLWTDPRGRDGKGEHHAHGVAVVGQTLWLATSAGLFRSSGDGWTAAGLAGRDLEDVVLTADGAVWVTTHEPSALFVSRDGGVAWREVPAPGELHEGSLVADPTARDRIVVAGKAALLTTTTDGGLTTAAAPALSGKGSLGVAAAGDRLIAFGGSRLATMTAGAWQVAAPVAVVTGRKPLTIGKFLDGLHTGALFGHALWIVYDVGAISMMLFVITGLHMWVAPILVKRRKRAKQAAKAAPRSADGSAS